MLCSSISLLSVYRCRQNDFVGRYVPSVRNFAGARMATVLRVGELAYVRLVVLGSPRDPLRRCRGACIPRLFKPAFLLRFHRVNQYLRAPVFIHFVQFLS